MRNGAALLVGAAAIMLLANCGGGGGYNNSGGGGGGAVYVTGVAAKGAPIGGATVTLKDAAGNTNTASTLADGSFQVTVTGYTPPYLLSVSSGGTTLYSYAAGNGVANLNPYTSVVLAAYYKALGGSVSTTFSGTLGASSFPGEGQVAMLERAVINVLQNYLSNAGVTQPSQFNPFSSAFTANHAGFDQVLDRTALNNTLLSFAVDNGSGTTAGATSSNVTITTTAGSGGTPAQVAVNTTTTNGGNSSSSQQSVPVGTSSTQQNDLAAAQTGVLATFSALHQLEVNKPGAVTAGDVAPYVDNAFLNKGDNAAAMDQKIAGFLNASNGSSTFTVSIYRANQFNDAAPATIDVTVRIDITTNGSTTTDFLTDNDDPGYGMVFKQESNGTWAFYGHQTLYNAHVDLQYQRLYDANSNTPNTAQVSLDMQTQVSTTTGALLGVSISGPANSLPDCTQNPSPLTQSSVGLAKDAGSTNGGDRWDLPCAFTSGGRINSTPAAGTPYTFAFTKSDNSTAMESDTLNSATTDVGDLTQINGTARAQFTGTVSSVAGTTVTLSWTPPRTYSLAYSFISAFCQNATEATSGGGTDINGTASHILPGTNTGTISIPAQCDGAAPARLGIGVNFIGVNGERSSVQQTIHN